jgi:hypothetical protein
MATVNLGVIKPVFKGAYNNSTAYVLDNIVTSGGSSYICILASTGNAVSNGTYWSTLAAGGTDVGTILTTQGDVLYRDGSGLQRLAKGTAGQALVMNSGATAPEWGTGGTVLQHQYVSKGSGVDAATSSSSTNTVSGAPFTLITSAFNSGTGSSIWSIDAFCGLNNETGDNWNSSCYIWVSYDNGSSWTQKKNPSAHASEGRYLTYFSGNGDQYTFIIRRMHITLTANQSQTKLAAAFFSAEGDNTRWNMTDGGGADLSCTQYAT